MGLSSQKCSIFCGFYILVIRSFWCNNRKGIFHQIFFWSSQERQLIRSFWSQQERYNSSDLSGLRMCIDFLCTAELPSHGLSTSVYNLSGSGTCWVIYPSRPIYTYIYMYRHALWVWGLYIYIYKSLYIYIGLSPSRFSTRNTIVCSHGLCTYKLFLDLDYKVYRARRAEPLLLSWWCVCVHSVTRF